MSPDNEDRLLKVVDELAEQLIQVTLVLLKLQARVIRLETRHYSS